MLETRQRYSDGEKASLVADWQQYRKQGLGARQAASRVGVSSRNIYRWIRMAQQRRERQRDYYERHGEVIAVIGNARVRDCMVPRPCPKLEQCRRAVSAGGEVLCGENTLIFADGTREQDLWSAHGVVREEMAELAY